MARDNWGRKNAENYHQRQRSQNRRPPLSWHSSVPLWEKKFCSLVGAVPWRKLLETKKCLYLYDGVVKWNDSAGEEAFWNAKKRFWAEINGIPCDIKLPDPDIYIDEIDWDAEIDPELLLDLEREPVLPEETEQAGSIVFLGSPMDLAQSIPCTGWGDDNEDLREAIQSQSLPRIEDCDIPVISGDDCGWNNETDWDEWGRNAIKENRWDSWRGWNEWDNSRHVYVNENIMKENHWDSSRDFNRRDFERSRHGIVDWVGRPWEEGRNLSRCRVQPSTFTQEDYQVYRGCRSRQGKDRWCM
ncbi:hypothetical protein Nepgr_020535 [Nepenthes gracilis]|uniref:Uncharacterized protein n=1 Tax=Nepenthes gracilis TaxID=150966 RepID=A0AAD3SXT4_NEPGR|nr:hypothetical protein Nepgr_020535 [Nepenthes gracilis]